MKAYRILEKLNEANHFFLPKYFFGYCLAGISSLLLFLFLQYISLKFITESFFYSHLFSSVISIFLGFKINSIFTFKKRKSQIKNKLLLYFLTNIVSLIINSFIANNLYSYIPIWYFASIIGILSSVIINFLSYKYIIWNKH